MESPSAKQHAILIVDDEMDICLALQDLFAGEGYRVDAVETGTDALNHIHPSHPYSAVILDLGLPDLDGLTVLQRLHEVDATLPVIILTAHGDQKEKISTLQHHAFAHFTKPYVREELTAIVQKVIGIKDLSLKVDQTERELHSSETTRQLESQQAQTLLSQSEQRLRLALKAGKMGIWDWDTDTNQIVWSDEVADLFGLAQGTLEDTYDAYMQCIHPDDRAMVAEKFRKALKEDVLYEVDHRIVWPTGEIRWCECKGQVVKNQEGRSPRIVGTVQDITTKKQDEKKLRASQTFLTSILENLPHMVFVKKAKGLQFLHFNKAGEDLLGYSRETLIGKTDYDFFSQEEANFFTRKDYEVLANKKLVDIPEEIIHTKFQGTRILHTKKIPLLDEEGNPQYLLGISEDITERKHGELERDERQLLLNLIYETGPGCVKRIAADGTLLHMNSAGLKLIEAEKESAGLGLSVFDLVTPEYRSAFEHMHQEVIRGKAQTLQFEGQGLKGGRRWMETYAVPFRNPLTKEVEHLAVTHDITERKQAEGLIRKGERKFRAIYEQAPTGIATLDSLSGRFTQINQKYCDIAGYSQEEMLDLTFQDITHPDDLQADLDHMQQLLAGRVSSFQMEKRYLQKNGQVIWVHLTCVPLWLKATDLRQHIAMVEDITYRKQAEVALRESEERFRLLSEAIPQQVWTANPDGSLDYVNQRVMEYFDRPREKLIGQEWQEVLHPDDLPACLEHWATARSTLQPYEIEFRLRRKDGIYRWHLSRALPIFGPDGQVKKWFGTNTDLTDVKQLEAQIRQGQKMEAIGTLAGGIAHDFNNILMAIMGFVELAKINMSKSENPEKNLNEVLIAGRRARELVQQILTFSRENEQIRELFNLKLLVKEVLRFLRASFPATIDIVQHFTEADTIIVGDQIQLHQVIVNLCTNAEYAMRGSGGLLELGLECIEVGNQGMALYPALEKGSYVCLTVRDSGKGIPSEIIPRIFDPFFTTKEIGVGTGMGLAVVHGIVLSHGGVITVDSDSGKGTTFTLYFPAMKAGKSGEDFQELTQEFIMGRGNILLVEDEEPLARLGQEALERLGYDVRVCTSSVEALEIFRADPHHYDVVITDQTMPNLTGDVLARKLLQLRPEVPIILCTGFSHVISPENAKAMGIRAFLFKPLLMRDLGRTLREVLPQSSEDV